MSELYKNEKVVQMVGDNYQLAAAREKIEEFILEYQGVDASDFFQNFPSNKRDAAIAYSDSEEVFSE